MKFATIGSNFIVHRFLEAAALVADFEYGAIYSRTEEKGKELANQYGVAKVYTDLEGLAQDKEIEVVYVASPNFLHAEQSILMMKHGKHVICEKPISSHARELAEMERVAKENDVVLMEAMKSVHCPGFDAVRDNLYKLGRIRNVTFNFLQYSSRYDNYKAGIVENAFKAEMSNGALMDIGVYTVHMLLALFGMPRSICAKGIMLETGADAAGTIICEYEDFLATLIYSKISSYEGNQIQGEDATMLIDKISDIGKVTIKYRDGREEEIVIDKQVTMYYEVQKFVDAINDHEQMAGLLDVTKKQMMFLDEVRGQLGIVFPADK
jgi:predicted dehydrogenase